jgi:Clathrin adaptor complex small chain
MQSPLMIWELIHRLVEMLNKTFENVSELDIMINSGLVRALRHLPMIGCRALFVENVEEGMAALRPCTLAIAAGAPCRTSPPHPYVSTAMQAHSGHHGSLATALTI